MKTRQKNHYWKTFCRITLMTGFVFAIASSTFAVPIVDSQGFEQPAYISGNLEGQNGWLPDGTGNSAVVQGAVVGSGSQAVEVTRNAAVNERWGVGVFGYPTEQYVVVEWDMKVLQTTDTGTTGFGPFFGVDSYDTDGGFGWIGTLGLDATTGEVLVMEGGTGFIAVAGTAPLGVWNHYEMVIDFGADEYSFAVNGSYLGTTGFVDSGLDQFTDANIATFSAGGDSLSINATGKAYFDNFMVTEVPEPSSFFLVLLGAIGLATVIRRR